VRLQLQWQIWHELYLLLLLLPGNALT